MKSVQPSKWDSNPTFLQVSLGARHSRRDTELGCKVGSEFPKEPWLSTVPDMLLPDEAEA